MGPYITPEISVIMPVFNAEPYVLEAVKSILQQTFTDFELLIINDGSTDNSEKIIFSIKDCRIRYFRNAVNLGIIHSRNYGLQQARGKFVAMMDADDLSVPERLEDQYNFMAKNPSAGVCGATMAFFGDKQGYFGTYGGPASIFTTLMSKPPFGQSTAFIRKSVLTMHSLNYNPEYPHAEDYKLWLDIAAHADIHCLPQTLVYYRWHISNDSKIYQNIQKSSSLNIQQDWFQWVLKRELSSDEGEVFTGKLSLKSCILYNLLCFLAMKNNGIPIDKTIVMEQRMRMNRLFINSLVSARSGKVMFPFSVIDRIISMAMIFFTSPRNHG